MRAKRLHTHAHRTRRELARHHSDGVAALHLAAFACGIDFLGALAAAPWKYTARIGIILVLMIVLLFVARVPWDLILG